MTAVRTTLNHSIGEDFSVKVTATNGKGTSELSTQSNTIAAQDVPQGKVTIDSNFTTTTSSVSISWTALTQNSDTGYSDITNYTITYSNTSAATNTGGTATSSTTSATISNLDEGATYQFVVTPTNVHGTGTNASDALSAVVRDVPSVVLNLVVNLESTNIVINWDTPANDNGANITAYPIRIKNISQSEYETLDQMNCSESDVVASTQCTLTQAYVTSQFGLSNGDTVDVEVKASNAAGNSAPTTASSLALP